MILVLGFILLPAIFFGIGLLRGAGFYDEPWGFIGICLLVVAVIVVGVGLPIERTSQYGAIAEYHSIEDSLTSARSNPSISEYELAAIQTKVIDANKWLASSQYWAQNPLTNWFWIKEIMELKPIR